MFSQDLRLSARLLLKSPLFASLAVLMLALGIGASTAMFSLVEGILLRPLPFPNPDRLVYVGEVLPGMTESDPLVTAVGMQEYIRHAHCFSYLGGLDPHQSYEFSGHGTPARMGAYRLTSGVLPALGVQPHMGRFFTQAEDEQKQNVVVITHAFWKTHLQGNPQVIGSSILLNRTPYEVIGVMPAHFLFPGNRLDNQAGRCFVPMRLTPSEQRKSTGWRFPMLGRLKPGINLSQAQKVTEQVTQAIAKGFPSSLAHIQPHAKITAMHESLVGKQRPMIRMLFLAASTVLLIACANLAGLLLVRSLERQREMALRMALGAPTKVLVRQSMMESILLSVMGGLLGLGFAWAMIKTGVPWLPEALPRLENLTLGWTVVAFALCLSLLTGVVCGLAPLFTVFKLPLSITLKEGGHQGSSAWGSKLRAGLVVGEMAITLLLLVTAGLFLRSFQKQCAVQLGFSPKNTLTAHYSLPSQFYGSQTTINTFNDQVQQKLRALPGVTQVGLGSILPLGEQGREAYIVEGRTNNTPLECELASITRVEGNYLQAMGIPLLAGRYFNERDGENAPLAVLVNQQFADTCWPGGNPIGKRIRFGPAGIDTPWMTVVGLVGNVVESLDQPVPFQCYHPARQLRASAGAAANELPPTLGGSNYIVLQSALTPADLNVALLSVIHSLDPQLPLANIRPMEKRLAENAAPRRFSALLVSAFALTTLLLTGLGIYGVIAFATALRSKEIAIRLALGAKPQGIFRLVLQQALTLALVGGGLGLLGTVAASTFIRSQLFGVSPLDLGVIALAYLAILLLTALAAITPAMKSIQTDPLPTLKVD